MATETQERVTPRERQVLDLAAAGRSNSQIARELGITRNAVRFHLKELHSKLRTDGNRELLRTRAPRAQHRPREAAPRGDQDFMRGLPSNLTIMRHCRTPISGAPAYREQELRRAA
ncbi:MAG: response regulator transcription factor [Hyphomicrobiales bacterium]